MNPILSRLFVLISSQKFINLSSSIVFLIISFLLLLYNSGESPFVTEKIQYSILKILSFLIYISISIILFLFALKKSFIEKKISIFIKNITKEKSLKIFRGFVLIMWVFTWLIFIFNFKFSTWFYGAMGILTSHHLFSDLSILLSQPNCVMQGLNPYESNPCNIVAMNYPFGWIYLLNFFGLKGNAWQPVLTNNSASFLIMIILVLPFLLLNLFKKLKPMGQLISSLLLISPPFMTLILQGNNDILILTLILLSLKIILPKKDYFSKKIFLEISNIDNLRIFCSLLIIAICSYLKLPAIVFLVGIAYELRGSRKFFITSLLLFFLTIGGNLINIKDILANSSYPIFFSFGIPSIKNSLRWFENPNHFNLLGLDSSLIMKFIFVASILSFTFLMLSKIRKAGHETLQILNKSSSSDRILISSGLLGFFTTFYIMPSYSLRLWILFIPIILLSSNHKENLSISTNSTLLPFVFAAVGASYAMPFSEYLGFIDQPLFFSFSLFSTYVIYLYLIKPIYKNLFIN